MIRLTDKMGTFSALNIINKQRKERDPSIPSSLLLSVSQCLLGNGPSFIQKLSHGPLYLNLGFMELSVDHQKF